MSDPFSVSNARCTWQFCEARADLRYQRRGASFCREHALFAWAVVEDEIRHSGMTADQLRAEREATEAAKQAELDRRWVARARHGTVYYLGLGEHIKIGFASDLFQRLTSYPPGSVLLAIEDGSLNTEAQRHKDFADYLAAGREWFDPGPRLVDHVDKLAATQAHARYTGWEKRPAKTRRKSVV